MSAPKIERPKCPVDKSQAISDIIESIALEETGLAHIINAEGEKIQRALEIADCPADLIHVNESVKDTLISVIKMQMLLQFKLEEAMKLSKDCCNKCKNVAPPRESNDPKEENK